MSEKEEMNIAVGRVKWFSESKGFGFIEDEEGQNVYVHYTAIANKGFKLLKEGAQVRFQKQDTERGPEALNVENLNS